MSNRHPVERVAEALLSLASFLVSLAEAMAGWGRVLRAHVDWLDREVPEWRKQSPRDDDD
ncbi:MAG: hypothetical protein ACRDVL_02585 [Acidimicrobiia bacterium]